MVYFEQPPLPPRPTTRLEKLRQTVYTCFMPLNRAGRLSLTLVELSLIILLALAAERDFLNFNPTVRMAGVEAEWTTQGAAFAAANWQAHGYLPWWQPYIDRGQPALEEGVSYVFNPLSFIPVLAFGITSGVKVAVVMYVALTGIGGWFLGRTLGWGVAARLLLAGLLIVKSNMQGQFTVGYFQLGVTQAYFPWVLAFAIGAAKLPAPRHRAYIVGLALSLALVLFAGNVYFTLPCYLIAAATLSAYGFRLSRKPFRIRLNMPVLRRAATALALALLLSAVYLLPFALNYRFLGKHPDYPMGEPPYDVFTLVQQLFSAQWLIPHLTSSENYYAYFTPLWFVVLALALVPFGLQTRLKMRDSKVKTGAHPALSDRRIWIVVCLLFVLFLAWGAQLPIIRFFYSTIPLLAQWRFPQRMLAVAAFFAAVLLALLFDLGWSALRLHADMVLDRRAVWRCVGALALLAASAFAVIEALNSRQFNSVVVYEAGNQRRCLTWLRAQHPAEFLAYRTKDSHAFYANMALNIRVAYITLDYDPSGFPGTLFTADMTNAMPPYVMLDLNAPAEFLTFWSRHGYHTVPNSPLYNEGATDGLRCWLYNPNVLAFAFSISADDLASANAAPDFSEFANAPLPIDQTTPLAYGRTPEQIWVEVPARNAAQVIVAQDIAYPGWDVEIAGEPAPLESIGQLLGVVVPPGSQPVQVRFHYTPRLLHIGGVVTLLAAGFSIGYLLLGRRPRKGRPDLSETQSAAIPSAATEVRP